MSVERLPSWWSLLWQKLSPVSRARTMHQPERARVPDPVSPDCPDFNASCITAPCLPCTRFARPHCARCCCARRCTETRHANASYHLPVRWLHIPKCGATFALTVIRHACLEMATWHAVYMALRGGRVDIRFSHAVGARHASHGTRCSGRLGLPFAGHRPVLPRDTAVVAIFRRPAQRVISAFLDNYHAWGLPGGERATMKAASPTIRAFARYPGIAGCMAKMLAGRNCAARLQGADEAAVLERALRFLRSDRISFVGLAERWHASICLFHRTLGGGSLPVAAEFRQLGHSRNSRREHVNPYLLVDNGVYNESLLGGFVDRLDETVYAEATRIFERNLKRCSHECSLRQPVALMSAGGRVSLPTRRN